MTSFDDNLGYNHFIPKNFVVWYKGGAGGFFVAWLLQLAQDFRHLEQSLQVFPRCLKQDSTSWTRHEKTPQSVAVLCNPFHPDLACQVNQEQEIRDVIEIMLSKDSSSMDNLLYCRIKMYLCNFVYQTGHITQTQLDSVINHPQKWHLDNLSFVKSMTDVLFHPEKNIFVMAPERYCELAAKYKGSRFYSSPLNQTVDQYPSLKKFRLDTIWRGRWIEELECILDARLTTPAVQACEQLVKRYLDIMPREMKDFCQSD